MTMNPEVQTNDCDPTHHQQREEMLTRLILSLPQLLVKYDENRRRSADS